MPRSLMQPVRIAGAPVAAQCRSRRLHFQPWLGEEMHDQVRRERLFSALKRSASAPPGDETELLRQTQRVPAGSRAGRIGSARCHSHRCLSGTTVAGRPPSTRLVIESVPPPWMLTGPYVPDRLPDPPAAADDFCAAAAKRSAKPASRLEINARACVPAYSTLAAGHRRSPGAVHPVGISLRTIHRAYASCPLCVHRCPRSGGGHRRSCPRRRSTSPSA